ncbi:T9SS type A sorting domain-containing protein, partial [candidate division TA06 bacterium]|nr:T9SS type A sorting domain-containing protein [candidate division TA06 bacterium]
YTVNHAAPIERTIWSYRVPDNLIGQTMQMHVTAMDRSGNIGNWSPYVQINTKVFTNSNTLLATAYNNGRHLLYDGNSKLHLTYTSADSIFYQNSKDDGYTWSGTWASGPGLYSGGKNPSSVIGIYGGDTVIAWKAETPLGGWVLKTAKHSGKTWQNVGTILEFGGGYEISGYVSPPAMVVNSAGTHLVIEGVDSYCAIGGQSGTWDWKLLYGFRPVGGSTFSWTVLDTASGGWGPWPTESPTICIDSKGGIHVAWDYDGEIYWRVYDPYAKAWKSKINLSKSLNVVSKEPSLAFYGDVHIVWQEGNDIWHNKGNWGFQSAYKSKALDKPFSWHGAENVSNNPDTASVNPVFDGNYIAWSEVMPSGDTEAYMSLYKDFAWQPAKNYSNNPTQPSGYPQIAYRQNVDGNKMTTIWTEGTEPLYSLIARDSAGPVTPQLAADVGGTEPSIYTIERDGYIVYGGTKDTASNAITVDYDSTALEYYLPTLDREQKQTLKMSLYQEYTDKADYIYQVWVDDASLGAVKVSSGQMVTFEKDLPNAVSHDGEGVLKIVNLKKGAIVTCDNWQLFAYDKATGRNDGHGGAQAELSEARPVAYRYELMQNAPNPCKQSTRINYQLAKPGQVSLKVYNTLGQAVKTLVNESQNPGPYSVKWDGRDETGRQTSAGIYFYRLNAGEFNSAKKMALLR